MDGTAGRLAITAASLVLLVAPACTTSAGNSGASTGTEPPAVSPSTTVITSRGWRPTPGEDVAAVKQAASDALVTLLGYDAGEGALEATKGRVVAAKLPASLAEEVSPLLDPAGASAVTVVYPQLAGFSPTSASVMATVDLRRQQGKRWLQERRVIELHLAAADGRWAVTAVGAVGGGPVDAPAPTPAVARLLRTENVELSDTNRWDLLSGRVDPRVVDLVLRLAERHRLAISVFSTGHPAQVFGTDRTSNHTLGRAVDIWAVDGVPVADQRQPGSPLEAIVRDVLAAGVTEIGSPYDFDGRGGAMFTDVVHHDHLHLGYRR